MPRRKPREACPVKGCGNLMIEDRLVCDRCWKLIPAKLRRGALATWKELRPFERRYWSADDGWKALPDGDIATVRFLVGRHERWCRVLQWRAQMRFNALGIVEKAPPPPEMARELKELGLL